MLLAALVLATSPVSIQLVDIRERVSRPEPLTSYERVRVRVANEGAREVTFRLCPGDAVSKNIWIDGKGVNTAVRAFAVSANGRGSFSTRCSDIALRPGQARLVDYFIRGENRNAPYQRREFRFTTNVGTAAFTTPSPARRG